MCVTIPTKRYLAHSIVYIHEDLNKENAHLLVTQCRSHDRRSIQNL
jgi:hypothetical protein